MVKLGIFQKIKIVSEVDLKQFPVLDYLGVKDSGFIVNGKGDVRGNLDTLSVVGDFRLQAGKNLNSLLSGEATILDVIKNTRKVSVDAELLNHHLRYSHPMKWIQEFHLPV